MWKNKNWKKFLAGIITIAVTAASVSLPDTIYGNNAAHKRSETDVTHDDAARLMEEETEKITDQETSEMFLEEPLSLEGTGSFGNLLTAPMNGKLEEQKQNNGCNIFTAEVSGNEVAVDFETTEPAILLAAVYDESGTKLLTSGEQEVSQEEKQGMVSIETESMPQYFYLRCFLIDSQTLQPLCTAYESPNYTQEMQELLAKTTADFDSEKVLNLDEDTANNFAVFSDNTKVISRAARRNQVTQADETQRIYVLERADEQITSLEPGDVFSYEYQPGNVLIVKVKTITIDDANPSNLVATIIGEDTSMDEVFEHVKIDAEAGLSQAEIDDAPLEEAITYKGLVEYSEDEIQAYAGETEAKDSMALSYKFSEAKLGSDDKNIKFTGSLEVKFETSVKYYLSWSYQYMEVKIDYSGSLKASVSGNAKGEIGLKHLKISPVPGIIVGFTPALVLEASLKLEVSATLKGTVGFSVIGGEELKNLTTTPELKSEIKGEVTFFVGLSLEPEVEVINENIAEASLDVEAGGEVKGEISVDDSASTSQKHDCNWCLDGDITGKLSIKVEAKLMNWDKLKYTHENEWEVKICDFYYSQDYHEFAFTTCPHITYQVKVAVKGERGMPILGAQVNDTYTKKDGIATLYLPNGTHDIKVSVTGYVTGKETVIVKDHTRNITVRLKKGKDEIKVKEISLGHAHSGAITEDGSLYMWGYNCYGQLGNGTTAGSNKPVKVLERVKSASLGGWHSGAITEDGCLYMWGNNSFGLLGDGTTTDSNKPVKVLEGVKSVSLGDSHSGAITEDGSLYMWGDNDEGRLGNGTTVDSNKPMKVLEGVKSVSLGGWHSGVITEDGSLYMWGHNYYGQLGNGTMTDSSRPIKVLEGVESVSLEGWHSGAITEDGSLYMWGDNHYGQLGNGTTTDSATPIQIHIPADSAAAPLALESSERASSAAAAASPFLPQFSPTVTEDSGDPVRKTACFANLLPNEIYNFYALKSREGDHLLDSSNLLCIQQGIADDSGNLSITYEMREEYEVPELFVMGRTGVPISQTEIQVPDLIYNGQPQFAEPSITYQGVPLEEGTDYELAGDFSVEAVGTYTLTIQGTGFYTGTTDMTYQVACQHVFDSQTVSREASCTEEGMQNCHCQICGATVQQSIPAKGHNYSTAWTIDQPASCTAKGSKSRHCTRCSARTDVTAIDETPHTYGTGKVTVKATAKKDGTEKKTCKICGAEETSTIYAASSSKLSVTNYTYNGKTRKPTVIISDRQGKKLKKDTDYTVSYPKGRKNVGRYKVVIQLKGSYSGTLTKTFTIRPKATSISKITSRKKGFVLKWKKRKIQTTGYQLQYSTSRKFAKKNTKTLTVKKNSITSKTVTKLKAGKKYYVRIRTYKNVKSNGKTLKIYSNWSKVKKGSTKK